MSALHSVLLCWDCKGVCNTMLILWVLLALVINHLSSSVYHPWWWWIQIYVYLGKLSDSKCLGPLKTSLKIIFIHWFITMCLLLCSGCSSLTSCCDISLYFRFLYLPMIWASLVTSIRFKKNIAVVSVTSLAFDFFGMWINTVYGKYCGIGPQLPQVPKGNH